jgi:ABC-type transport system involved in multi-copper enzyme maturation permease subunit
MTTLEASSRDDGVTPGPRVAGLSLPRLEETRPTNHGPLTRLIGVEARKQLDTRAGRWLLIAIGGITALLLVVLLFVDGGKHTFRELLLATITPQAILLPIVGILAVTSEWSQRAALVTFTLEPRRGRVAAAKTISALLVGVVALVVAVGLAALAHLASIGLRGAEADWVVPANVLLGFALSLLLGVAQGVAFGMILLNTPAAIVAYLVLPTVWSVLGGMVDWLKTTASWLDLTTTVQPLVAGTITGDQWVRLATATAVWVALPLAAGIWRIIRSEVK